MAIPSRSCFDYAATLHADVDGAWMGTADAVHRPSLVGHQPSLTMRNGRVTLTRDPHEDQSRSLVETAELAIGDAPAAVFREGDRLSVQCVLTGDLGLSVLRAGRLHLALGVLADLGDTELTVEHDPRVEQIELARQIRYIDRPGTTIVWLDPENPPELQARLQDLEEHRPRVPLLAIVARTDDPAVRLALNRRTMRTDRYRPGACIFLTAAERFPDADAWLRHGRSLPCERPDDVWLRVRIDGAERLVPQGTTAVVGDWLVHAHRVHEPGVPGRWSQLGLLRADAGVSASTLEGSAAAVARGLTLQGVAAPTGRPSPRQSPPSR